MPVIGYLGDESPETAKARLVAFHQGLAEMNYAVGRNVAIEFRWANGDQSRLPELAAELVRLKVSVIVAPGSASVALAAKKASSTIPVVFGVGIDPAEAGLVKSLSRPGGNVTGVTSLNTQVGPRRLQLLTELVPGLKSFALLINPASPRNAEVLIDNLQVAAHAQRLQIQVVQASTEQDLAVVFDNLARQRVSGLLIANDAFLTQRSREIAALSLRYRIPVVHTSRDFVAVGGLASFGGKVSESDRLMGIYTGRILHGEKPASLPVQRVSQQELFVNLKTAQALGITVPKSVLARADEVIK